VSQFGAALLRGMGWKEGTAASRTRPGLVEPWLPPSRPALLGIGARERPQEDIPPTGAGKFVSKRPDKRYVPVVKVQREVCRIFPYHTLHPTDKSSRALSFHLPPGQDHAHLPDLELCRECLPPNPHRLTLETTLWTDDAVKEAATVAMMSLVTAD
jgi:G-patch domain